MSPRILTHLVDLLRHSWPAPGARRLLLLAPPVLAAAGLCAVLVFGTPGGSARATPAAGGQPTGAAAAGAGGDGAVSVPPPSGLLVEVSGAGVRPGMYRVAKGERVSVAVAAASGLAPDADPDRLPNMAARLKDGQQVVVPRLGAPGRTTSPTGRRITRVSLNLAS